MNCKTTRKFKMMFRSKSCCRFYWTTNI